MKQASSASKVNEENIGSKKLNSSRNNIIKERENLKSINRLKSNQEGEVADGTNTKIPFKPRSSLGKRPSSSQKHTETVTVMSNATTSSARSE